MFTLHWVSDTPNEFRKGRDKTLHFLHNVFVWTSRWHQPHLVVQTLYPISPSYSYVYNKYYESLISMCSHLSRITGLCETWFLILRRFAHSLCHANHVRDHCLFRRSAESVMIPYCYNITWTIYITWIWFEYILNIFTCCRPCVPNQSPVCDQT